jgi:two-component system NtrC family sensor kinase
MQASNVLIYSEDEALFRALAERLPQDCTAERVAAPDALREKMQHQPVALLALALPPERELAVLEDMSPYVRGHSLLVVTSSTPSVPLFNSLLGMQPEGVITYPFEDDGQAQDVIASAWSRAKRRAHRRYLHDNLTEANRRLNQRLQEINTIYTVGKSVASSLDVQEVLERIVAASVNLTQAEEGFILLREDDKLYLRIAQDMNEEVAQRFCVEASDNIAWQVIRSGRPTMLHRETKIATGYLVCALLYVPLIAPGRGTIGVLGVVNLLRDRTFTENHLFTLSSIADFAAIALENARLFNVVAAERSRLSTILEDATEAILVTDDANRLWLWSEAATESFDLPSDAEGDRVEAHIENEALRELFNRADEGMAVSHAEIELGDGRVFNAQLSAVEGVGRVVVMQDITHLKELDRLKSEFVSTVSHDLRTPLTTVQGYIELLERVGPLNDMQQNFIHKALSSLSHITALIGDLLDIGRIEAGYDLEMQPLRMEKVLQQIAEDYEIQASQKDIELRMELQGQPLWVRGNSRRLRQVLDNLLSNAVKYGRSEGWVKLRARPDGRHVIVSVQDNGIGIPLEEQPKIFERFYRVQTPETEDIRGTGLGLAIVKSVIEKHKGRVWVRSTPGEGSTFAFVLSACVPPSDVED